VSATSTGALPARHRADSHDMIRVHGARVNNLKDVSLEIPKRRLTVFTGVSGSGKSSLVFDTIAAESQRLINETYSTFVQGFMPTLARPEVDLGPGAGAAGGEVVFKGTVEELRESDTITGRHLEDRASLKPSVRTPSGALEVRGASTNNLQDVDVDIPLGVLVALTGVAGSGKSSLIDGSVSGRDGVVTIDQGAIHGSRRSSRATYTGLLDPVRKAFAKTNGVKPALFSANSKGACPNCNGAGVIYTGLTIMASVASTCEECEGKRFDASVLEHKLGGRDISEVLSMPVTEAEAFFSGASTNAVQVPAAHKILQRLVDVGLGYLSLGQPLTTLSGGERQRLRLATQMVNRGSRPPHRPDGTDSIYVLDEPTAGLHLADVEQLLGLLDRLVDSGKSVIVIEHHQAVMATPTGSSTWAPGQVMTAAGSCSRVLRPTSSRRAPPSRASTWRPTSDPDAWASARRSSGSAR
jgi:excinuclease UvrABC ATPase subunit